jgi:hypothetical protein
MKKWYRAEKHAALVIHYLMYNIEWVICFQPRTYSLSIKNHFTDACLY